MAIEIVNQFDDAFSLPLSKHTLFETVGDLMAHPHRKLGVIVYVSQPKIHVFWDGVFYIYLLSGMPLIADVCGGFPDTKTWLLTIDGGVTNQNIFNDNLDGGTI